jgi:adenylate cyclase
VPSGRTKLGLETERRFLADSVALGPLLVEAQRQRLRQGYLNADPGRRIRVRVSDAGYALLTVKGQVGPDGLTRPEVETTIDPVAAEALLQLALGRVIDKTRYRLAFAGRTWDVDLFHGELAALAVAEVELAHAGEAVELPSWVGKEITHVPGVGNFSLATEELSLFRQRLGVRFGELSGASGKLVEISRATGYRVATST